MNKKDIRISKFLSLVLRHKPATIGLSLDAQGWAPVDLLITRAQAHGHAISHADLERVVKLNNKQRFSLSEDTTRIRANQGHSIAVDLDLQACLPPTILYHGTAQQFLPSIRKQGLLPSGRHHVHMSTDLDTAEKVGRRHGRLVVLRVKAGEMHEAGYTFFCSANGVWLTDQVPPGFLIEGN